MLVKDSKLDIAAKQYPRYFRWLPKISAFSLEILSGPGYIAMEDKNMKSPKDPADNIGEQGTATSEPETVSQKKLNANQQNGKKSNGPRTARGKAISRKNAIKHGLFAMLDTEFELLGESREDYDRLLDDLHKEFEPIGRAEELEVERIRGCWWKLQRVWRYENSENHSSVFREVGKQEELDKACQRQVEEAEAILLGLQNMIDEVSAASELPPDLKDRFFVLTSSKEQDWQNHEYIAEIALKKKESELELPPILSTRESRRRRLAYSPLLVAHNFYEGRRRAKPFTMKFTLGQHIIPKGDALDKILRYDTAIDRNLGRAYDRLERLQRRRKGEPVLPPVNLQLT
jgi:hypothetical protein